jgi:hypothetical protein
MKISLLGGLLGLWLLSRAITGYAYDVTLGWDPTSESDLNGYVLYLSIGQKNDYAVENTILLDTIEADRPRVTVADLDADTRYYFVVTAFNADGFESGYSNELCVENGKPCSGDGSPGMGCFSDSVMADMPWAVLPFHRR